MAVSGFSGFSGHSGFSGWSPAVENSLLRSSNLADLTSFSAARANLGVKPLDTSYTLTNSCTGDFANGSVAIATLSDGLAKTMSIANLTALRIHTFKMKNTHASTSITITLPTAAGNNRSNATFTLPAGYRRAVEVLYDGAEYWWTVGRLKTVTV
jgi:hypothetical protein